ncbi:hypothetical protein [Lysinibacillus pakistanensis]|nr:hypothetical protein [Lysinibacillus pakistanensis]
MRIKELHATILTHTLALYVFSSIIAFYTGDDGKKVSVPFNSE